jgi:HD-GYP domain-containing protein (c-di-GMP phosphodiesterase class II)
MKTELRRYLFSQPLAATTVLVAATAAAESWLFSPWATIALMLPIALVYRGFRRGMQRHESARRFFEDLADMVDNRDPCTRDHSKRVLRWTQELLREMHVPRQETQVIALAARTHDIGKIGLPEEILHKHGKLTPAEWTVVEQHPGIGAQALSTPPGFSPRQVRHMPYARAAAIVRHHHERWDGKGYPDRLAGPDIPFGARVIAVVDSFDAMTSDRPYRRAMSVERAAGVLSAGRGTQWDPEIVNAFLGILASHSEDIRAREHLVLPLDAARGAPRR